MFFPFKTVAKYFLILFVTMGMGYSVWLLPHENKKTEKHKDSGPITSPIDARDEASRYLQQASEGFFYHEFDKAIENYGRAITTYEKENKPKKAAKVYESLGDLHKFRRNLKQAEEQYLLAIKYHHRIKNPLGEARSMNHAGDLMMEQGDTKSAGIWYKKGVGLVKDETPSKHQALIFENLGRFYWKTEKNTPEAIVWYTRARDTFADLENQMGYDHMSAVLNKLRGGQNLNTH
jgi:tetratricopeptide (TPR) repeat protein